MRAFARLGLGAFTVLALWSCNSLLKMEPGLASRCQAESADFVSFSQCMDRSITGDMRFKAPLGENSDLDEYYLAYVNALAGRVSSGQVSSDDAYKIEAQLREQLAETIKQRHVNRGSVALPTMLAGVEPTGGTKSNFSWPPSVKPIVCYVVARVVTCQ